MRSATVWRAVMTLLLAASVGVDALPVGAATESPSLVSRLVARDHSVDFTVALLGRTLGSAPSNLNARMTQTASESQPSESALPLQPSVVGSVLRTVALSLLSPPVPDPTGIAYDAARGRLLVSDSEVEETSYFAGINMFNLSGQGAFLGGGSTLPFSAEPTGIGFNSANGNLFVSDDVKKEVFEVDPGQDGFLFTPDDVVTSFDTLALGSSDPEGVEYDPITGYLYILDGLSRRLLRIDPGQNGEFDGAGGDDIVMVIDVGSMGAQDPEGLALDVDRRVLLVADHNTETIYEITRGGVLFRTVDISPVGGHRVAGLTVAPRTATPGENSVFLVYRGIDNAANPAENDGVLVELSIPPPSLPPGGTFVDDDGNAHEANIEAIAALGITEGCNPPHNDEFCPNASVTRAEMAVFLVRAMGEAASLPSHRGYFTDVDEGAWFAPWVERLFELGVTVGFADGTYRPNAPVTRGEMSVFLVSAFDHTAELADPVGLFVDVDLEVFYADDVELLRALGVTAGCSSSPLRYCPRDPVRRDQMATFLAGSMNLTPVVPPPG